MVNIERAFPISWDRLDKGISIECCGTLAPVLSTAGQNDASHLWNYSLTIQQKFHHLLKNISIDTTVVLLLVSLDKQGTMKRGHLATNRIELSEVHKGFAVCTGETEWPHSVMATHEMETVTFSSATECSYSIPQSLHLQNR